MEKYCSPHIFVITNMKASPKPDTYWAYEFQKGNAAAFRHIFDVYYRALCYFAGTMIDDADEVEDVVSEVFVKLWQKSTDFNSMSRIKGFLYIATKNLCIDRLRQQRRNATSMEDYFYGVDQLHDSSDQNLLETEVLRLIYEEIEHLPTRAQAIFKLIFFEGLRTDEVALRLGISVKTVRNQKARAVQLLQIALHKRGVPTFLWVVCCIWYR